METPFAGRDELKRQISASKVREVTGDVLTSCTSTWIQTLAYALPSRPLSLSGEWQAMKTVFR